MESRTPGRDGPIALRALAVVLRPAPVLAILAMAVVLAVAFKTAPFGIPLALMVLSWNARHSIAVLHAVGAGAREVPVLSLEMILGSLHGWRSFFAMLVMTGLLFATGAAAFWVGIIPAVAAGVVVAAMLPIALLVLGWTNHIAQAMHPPTWWRVARALGFDFLQLEAVGIVLVGVVALLSGTLHAQLIARIATMLLGWLLLVVLAGVTMHARRSDLAALMPLYAGIEKPPSPAELARRRQESIDTVYMQWRNGAKADAWRSVEQLASAATSPEAELRWIYQQSLGWDAAPLAAKIAGELIHLDLRGGRSGHALRTAREQLATNQQFKPSSPQEALVLARLALQFQEPAIASALLEGFERTTSDEALLAEHRQLRESMNAKSRR